MKMSVIVAVSVAWLAVAFAPEATAANGAPKSLQPGHPGFPKTAGDLRRDCSAPDPASSEKAACVAFIDATWQSSGLMNHMKRLCLPAGGTDRSPEIFCVPGDATLDQVIRVVVRYVDQHPERQGQLAYGEAMNAMLAAWPCAAAKK